MFPKYHFLYILIFQWCTGYAFGMRYRRAGIVTFNYMHLEDIWSHLGLRLEHIWNTSGTCLEQIWNTFGTHLERIRNKSGTQLEHIWSPLGHIWKRYESSYFYVFNCSFIRKRLFFLQETLNAIFTCK